MQRRTWQVYRQAGLRLTLWREPNERTYLLRHFGERHFDKVVELRIERAALVDALDRFLDPLYVYFVDVAQRALSMLDTGLRVTDLLAGIYERT